MNQSVAAAGCFPCAKEAFMSRNRFLHALLQCMLALLFHGVAAGETIRVGVTGPFSGASAAMGESMRNGARLAADEINSAGGIEGRLVELVERDDQGSDTIGAGIAQELVAGKVAATVGVVNAGVGLASIDAYQEAGIPLIIAAAVESTLTRKYAQPNAGENYVFRVAPSLELEVGMLVSDLKRKGLASAAVMADTSPSGEAGLVAFVRHARQAGVAVPVQERFEPGAMTMMAQVRRARVSGAEALVVWGNVAELAVIARNKAALGWKAAMLGSGTLTSHSFITLAGTAGEGVFMPLTFIQDIGSSSKNAFLLAYKRAFEIDDIRAPMAAAQAYDGMHLLALAIRQAGSTDGARIKEALENLKIRYQGAITTYHKPFSHDDHEAITQNMLVMGTIFNGAVDYAYATDRRRGGLIRYKAHHTP
jgi:branched-chain amino acid transport system substrate-binding protein